MNVQDLIEELELLDSETEVYFSYPSGDHWRTELARPVSTVEETFIERTDYHRMDKVSDDQDVPSDEARMVIVIN